MSKILGEKKNCCTYFLLLLPIIDLLQQFENYVNRHLIVIQVIRNKKKIEDTKEVMRCSKLMKDGQYNGQISVFSLLG
jgi:hypothetical protein